MYKILRGEVAVPMAEVGLEFSQRPSHGSDTNRKKSETLRTINTEFKFSFVPSRLLIGTIHVFQNRLQHPPLQHHLRASCSSIFACGVQMLVGMMPQALTLLTTMQAQIQILFKQAH